MFTLLKRIAYALGRFFPPPRDAAVILMYHSIGNNSLRLTVSPKMFEAQMGYLKGRGFNVVSLDTLAGYRMKGSIPPKTVVLTFDDGYRDNYQNAFPILKRFGFPATIFLMTSDIGAKRDVRGVQMEILSESELRALHAGGVTIGAHSVTHPRFTQISASEAAKEAGESKAFVERVTNAPCVHFAYPHGRYNPPAANAVEKAGFIDACATEDGFVKLTSSSYAFPRNEIIGTTSLADFGGIVRIGRLSFTRFRRTKTL